MKAGKSAIWLAQIQPKSQLLFHNTAGLLNNDIDKDEPSGCKY